MGYTMFRPMWFQFYVESLYVYSIIYYIYIYVDLHQYKHHSFGSLLIVFLPVHDLKKFGLTSYIFPYTVVKLGMLYRVFLSLESPASAQLS